jgi:hypothetical protein
MATNTFPFNNLTHSVLHAAKKGKYAVGAYNWYVWHLWLIGSIPC